MGTDEEDLDECFVRCLKFVIEVTVRIIRKQKLKNLIRVYPCHPWLKFF